ncbi:hypothetical protein BDW22DRAFT_565342 [Trametopsis cervina]|nr:hypothetical protein BDW22DRAFT_565342 [Trametopsis cervina]
MMAPIWVRKRECKVALLFFLLHQQCRSLVWPNLYRTSLATAVVKTSIASEVLVLFEYMISSSSWKPWTIAVAHMLFSCGESPYAAGILPVGGPPCTTSGW